MTAQFVHATERIGHTLRRVVELLVQHDYAGLERLTRGVRLPASEMAGAIREYGRTLVMPPADAYSQADVMPIDGSSPEAYSVDFRLYTEEEGRSDLEIRLTLIDTGVEGMMKVELDDILVG